MVTSFGKTAVLLGGHSAEREVSLMSGHGVLAALRSRGVDAHAFDPALQDISELKKQGFEHCFIALHGRFGEDGTVQGALELLGIPYTGSGVKASAIAMDKIMTKRLWAADGLATPGWFEVQSCRETFDAFIQIGSPMIVKPAHEGSTIGLTKVIDAGQCERAYLLASQHDPIVLCEQFISGDEVTCSILGTGANSRALPLVRIVAPDGNYDYHNKYFGEQTRYLVPSGLPLQEERNIQDLALRAFKSLGCSAWARADVMIDSHTRKPYLLEINTSPGMTGHSLVPMSARAVGLTYEDLCMEVLSSARRENVP